jgi:hypothetical protein
VFNPRKVWESISDDRNSIDFAKKDLPYFLDMMKCNSAY